MGELLTVISSDELTEWAAFYQVEPFGHYRGDFQAAVIASTMANIHAKKGHTFSPKDFMPNWSGKTREAMSGEEILAHFERGLKGNA